MKDIKLLCLANLQKCSTLWVNGTTEEGFYTERIDGSVSAKARMEAVDRFQTSEKPGMFLIS